MTAKFFPKCKSSKNKKGKGSEVGRLLWSAASSKDSVLRQELCSILMLSILLSLEHLFKHSLSPRYVYVSLHLHKLKGADSYHQEGLWDSRQSEPSFTKLPPSVVIFSSKRGSNQISPCSPREGAALCTWQR